MSTTKQALRPGDRVRATIEATVVVADNCGVVLHSPNRQIVTVVSDNWTFEVLSHRAPVVGDVIPRDDVNNYSWSDGAVLRTTVPNGPVHRAGGMWFFGSRLLSVRDFPPGIEFEVLAVDA